MCDNEYFSCYLFYQKDEPKQLIKIPEYSIWIKRKDGYFWQYLWNRFAWRCIRHFDTLMELLDDVKNNGFTKNFKYIQYTENQIKDLKFSY